ncbi:MAG: FkbM family methyltransferase [Chloroflexi bacterium]|nr:FkbM family methyltransferase [Chloroflexota bacterium]
MIEQLAGWILPDRFMNKIFGGRVVTIRDGVGAGLKFDTHRASGDYRAGLNELPVQQALAKYLKPGDVFYDVGANVGFFTMIGARLVGESGHAYAFEPVPENVAVIRHNAHLNRFNQVQVIQKAIGATSGKAELLLTKHPGGATLVSDHRPPDATVSVSAELASLDDLFINKVTTPPSVIKVDVEGAEKDVITGMARLLRAIRPIVLFEIDDENPAPFEAKAEECSNLMRAAGYDVTRLEDSYTTLDWHVGHFLALPR